MIPRVRAILRRGTLVLLPTILAACAMPGSRYLETSPVPEGIERDVAVESAIAVIQTHGYTPGVVNERVGTITTDWRNTDDWLAFIFGRRGRDRLVLTITDSLLKLGGEYQVRDGPSFFAMFDEDGDQPRDTGWFTAAAPEEMRSEWDAIRAELATSIASLPRGNTGFVMNSVADSRSAQVLHTQSIDVTPLPADERMRIAVAQFDGIGLSDDDVTILSDRLRAELVDTGHFVVVERERMDEILEEQGFQQAGLCATDECVVEIGRLIGVTGIVAGTFGKLGGTYTVTARLIDVETGAITARASEDCPCAIDELLQSMQRISSVLASRLE